MHVLQNTKFYIQILQLSNINLFAIQCGNAYFFILIYDHYTKKNTEYIKKNKVGCWSVTIVSQ